MRWHLAGLVTDFCFIDGAKTNQKNHLDSINHLGKGISSVLSYYLATNIPIAKIDCYHIQYLLIGPMHEYWFRGLFYFIPTVIPLFISSMKKLWIFGIAIVIAYIVTQLFYLKYALSVWCFFAAILSLIIYYVMKKISDSKHSEKMKEWYKN